MTWSTDDSEPELIWPEPGHDQQWFCEAAARLFLDIAVAAALCALSALSGAANELELYR